MAYEKECDELLRYLDDEVERGEYITVEEVISKIEGLDENIISVIGKRLRRGKYIYYQGDSLAIRPEGQRFVVERSFLQEKRRQDKEDYIQNLTYWKHKLWWLIAIATFILGIVSGVIIDLIKCP
jgi:hypothetical protein